MPFLESRELQITTKAKVVAVYGRLGCCGGGGGGKEFAFVYRFVCLRSLLSFYSLFL